ncbi:MAG: hypothetical protein M3Q79_00670 [bacterium]|nr:hypothetical protein [bacterium]
MTDRAPDEFDELLSKANHEEALREHVEVIKNRFRLFLGDRGVLLDKEAVNQNTEMSPEVLQGAPSLEALIARNNIHLIDLVTQKAMIDIVPPENIPVDIKKQIQAQQLIRGFSPAWSDLVDIEFPGEPLTENDEGIIFAESAAMYLINSTSDTELKAAKQKLFTLLSSEGAEHLTELENLAVIVFSSQVAMNTISEQTPNSLANQSEQMRISAINWGLDMGIWGTVINKLFQPEQPDS